MEQIIAVLPIYPGDLCNKCDREKFDLINKKQFYIYNKKH